MRVGSRKEEEKRKVLGREGGGEKAKGGKEKGVTLPGYRAVADLSTLTGFFGI